MLEAVGHPYAVNPDKVLRRAAVQRDWPVLDFNKPVRLRKRVPFETRRTVAAVAFGSRRCGRWRGCLGFPALPAGLSRAAPAGLPMSRRAA